MYLSRAVFIATSTCNCILFAGKNNQFSK